IAGITGGLIFVVTSSIVMEYLAKHSLSRWSSYVCSGIGLGIYISGICVPLIEARLAWQGTWLGLGILSVVFLLKTTILWRGLEIQDTLKVANSSNMKMPKDFMPWLILPYGLEGLGNIITGTFLVDIIHNIPSLQAYSSYSWVIVGLAAIPSEPVWTILLEKFSAIKILFVVYILQVKGILLPVFVQTVWSVLVASFLLGLTFVGIVTLTTFYARQLFPTQSGFVVSLLTTF
ncbi:YbfB/YjiJ family MFS transporter, partial [Lysinibacillus sp. D4B1_S16]|uniref:YbfB/YjiJ family MFS transporter n=1 Tax=Lysinibacillus sp. D4B1_S16 TaxID=2941231 RepID=UPI0020C09113